MERSEMLHETIAEFSISDVYGIGAETLGVILF